MKKFLFVFLFCSLPIFAEIISVDLICDGEQVTNCDQDNICDTQMVVERIKIDGNTFVHKVHGNYFMEVDAESAKINELDDNGNIGFSVNISRKNGDIKIIKKWQDPYTFSGVCQLGRPSIVEHQFD